MSQELATYEEAVAAWRRQESKGSVSGDAWRSLVAATTALQDAGPSRILTIKNNKYVFDHPGGITLPNANRSGGFHFNRAKKYLNKRSAKTTTQQMVSEEYRKVVDRLQLIVKSWKVVRRGIEASEDAAGSSRESVPGSPPLDSPEGSPDPQEGSEDEKEEFLDSLLEVSDIEGVADSIGDDSDSDFDGIPFWRQSLAGRERLDDIEENINVYDAEEWLDAEEEQELENLRNLKQQLERQQLAMESKMSDLDRLRLSLAEEMDKLRDERAEFEEQKENIAQIMEDFENRDDLEPDVRDELVSNAGRGSRRIQNQIDHVDRKMNLLKQTLSMPSIDANIIARLRDQGIDVEGLSSRELLRRKLAVLKASEVDAESFLRLTQGLDDSQRNSILEEVTDESVKRSLILGNFTSRKTDAELIEEKALKAAGIAPEKTKFKEGKHVQFLFNPEIHEGGPGNTEVIDPFASGNLQPMYQSFSGALQVQGQPVDVWRD